MAMYEFAIQRYEAVALAAAHNMRGDEEIVEIRFTKESNGLYRGYLSKDSIDPLEEFREVGIIDLCQPTPTIPVYDDVRFVREGEGSRLVKILAK